MNFITTLILSNFVHLPKLSLMTSLNPIKNTEKERGSQVPDTKSKYDNNVKATYLMGSKRRGKRIETEGTREQQERKRRLQEKGRTREGEGTRARTIS